MTQMSKKIIFIDTEIGVNNKKILDIGAIDWQGNKFHSNGRAEFEKFIADAEYLAGHNILAHDLVYLSEVVNLNAENKTQIIDTLYISPLVFPDKPYHALLKDDKLQTEERNNPLNDAIKSKELFFDEVAKFEALGAKIKSIYYLLLGKEPAFSGFFDFLDYKAQGNVAFLIRYYFKDRICENADVEAYVAHYPIALAYCLALIDAKESYSITPPWVLHKYPEVEYLMILLRATPCGGCGYCSTNLDARAGLKKYFGFDGYRSYGGVDLQEQAARAALANKSLLAIFPTGGGKSITFQVPALMMGENTKGLTVIISPLQSLMKDQVDNLERGGITSAVTINGLLDPIERAKSFERVADGSAHLLYISPESLRSKSIERLLLGRKIARFVIDEAHCFSSWGQDFRIDYLYIADFIKALEEKKQLSVKIPVSCFTATAKKKVVEDICAYFKDKLDLDLSLFTTKVARTNLHYKVLERAGDEEKYQAVRELIEEHDCPTIIYVSRTKRTKEIAERLNENGFKALAFNGKMDSEQKIDNQNAFISGEVNIMVATSAFGMGVDKKDVGLVVHYDISDSLENYVQEAGRAGRDEHISAECYVLFSEEDLNKHFILLTQTKIDIKQIKQIWKAVKDLTRFRENVSKSALEIAREAGWDDTIQDIETRVTTAIAALEDAGYLQRGQNSPRVFANSIVPKSNSEAMEIIRHSERMSEEQKGKAARIISRLFSSKTKIKENNEAAEYRLDYLADNLGIVKADVIQVINLLREENILADEQDLTAFIKRSENRNQSLAIVKEFVEIEKHLLSFLDESEQLHNLKALNEQAIIAGLKNINSKKIKTILTFWAIKRWAKQHIHSNNQLLSVMLLDSRQHLQAQLDKRSEISLFIVNFLYQKIGAQKSTAEEILIHFSVHELKQYFIAANPLFSTNINLSDIEDSLFYLSRINAIKIEGGFMVIYNKLNINRIELDNRKNYTITDYTKLSQFYAQKVQQIHIIGEYAKKMISDYIGALQFVADYFQDDYSDFVTKYFKGDRRNEIKLSLTPNKFKQLFGELSPTQLQIINDNETQYIVVAAGPGSGKTKVLVHKLAALLLMEEVKHEQILMLTFSRAAATEFKKRLIQLIGNAAHFVEIKTFHAYCFDLLGKNGTLEEAENVVKNAVEHIKNNEIEPSRITKTVLVIDEAQDMNGDDFALVEALIAHNEEMKIIAVGDDDQNIYEFRGASPKYLRQLLTHPNNKCYELISNYRSRPNLVDFTNQFATGISQRIKSTPIQSTHDTDGEIHIYQYQSPYLIVPVVNNILQINPLGTICVLTSTNEEAAQVCSLLLQKNKQAKLIQSNDGFPLLDLVEMQYFLQQLPLPDNVFTINDALWQTAKNKLSQTFEKSNKLELAQNIIQTFEAIHRKVKYKADFITFVNESRMEDFMNKDEQNIIVSTIHKAKGWEFDHVFLLLDRIQQPQIDETKRKLYVAFTRAKQSLYIHYNDNYLSHINTRNLQRISDNAIYNPHHQQTIHLTLKDIWLDYSANFQQNITALHCGERLNFHHDEFLTKSGNRILKISKKFSQDIANLAQSGYTLIAAKVNFILYWTQKTGYRIKIVLPTVLFNKKE
jgi:ATP-dependent DNA helicase RecQ